MVLFKMFILLNGISRNRQIRISKEEVAALEEKTLPVYTVLVPLYKEKEIASKLFHNIENLDYPS